MSSNLRSRKSTSTSTTATTTATTTASTASTEVASASTYIKYNVEIRFILYVLGLYVIFIRWGYLQEKITTRPYYYDTSSTHDSSIVTGDCFKFSYAFTLNLCMAISCACIAYVAEIIFRVDTSDAPLSTFLYCAITSVFASPTGYTALKYVSYPLMILTKSCKPVPVIIIGVIMFHKSYPWYKYVSVGLLCSGIVLFSVYQTKSKASSASSNDCITNNSNHSDPILQPLIHIFADYLSVDSIRLFTGVSLVLLNLLLDGFTNNEQDRINDEYKKKGKSVSGLEMMKCTNIWQSIIISVLLLIFYFIYGNESELYHAVMVIAHCSEIRTDLVWFCLCASVGQMLIFNGK